MSEERLETVPEAEKETGEPGAKKKKGKKDGELGSRRGIETVFRTSYRTHTELSAQADAKANIMISINGLIVSIVIAAISPKIDTNPWLILPTSGLLIGCLISMVYAILSARPRVTHEPVSLEDVRNDRKNILFFGNFVNMRQDDYELGMKELMANTERLYTNMVRDLYSLGGVLERKFRLLRTSYTTFMYGLTAGVLLYLAVYAWVVMNQDITIGL